MHALRTPLVLVFLVVGLAAQTTPESITLERIMADPDWIGRAPAGAYWADDGRSVYWFQKRVGSRESDLVQTGLDGRELRRVTDAERPWVDVPGGRYDRGRTLKVYARDGDLFLKHLTDDSAGTIVQITRTATSESGPFFLADGRRIAFRRGGSWYVRDLITGLEALAADVRGGEDPEAKQEKERAEPSWLAAQNRRLLTHLEEQATRRDEADAARKARRGADPTRPPEPVWLGAGLEPDTTSLSPNGFHLAITFGKPPKRGRRDSMPEWVTESSYVEPRDVRTLVGTDRQETEHLAVLDARTGRLVEIDLSLLPEIRTDRLAAIRPAKAPDAKPAEPTTAVEAAVTDVAIIDVTEVTEVTVTDETPEKEVVATEKKPAGTDEKPGPPRPVRVGNLTWTDGGTRLAAQVLSRDNKDRWTIVVDVTALAASTGDKIEPDLIEHRYDEAWIGGIASDLGWLDENRLWYQSERTGWAHLYVVNLETGEEHGTAGTWEATRVEVDPTRRFLYFRANAEHPGITELHRYDSITRETEAITSLGGMNSADLSPDGARLLITHSEALAPPELWVQDASPDATPRRLTETVTDEFGALPWVAPTFVTVPGEDGALIHARLYLPPRDRDAAPRPAVIFVHGAGYLQNADQGWSGYFREFMFHSLLAYRGYVVLDMDYRASAGYGRDWRTAIYRQMGTPELADLQSGVAWLTAHHRVDPARVGVYGGSYGGFMALMALFKAPELFACGAALRPVTDWAHYNHGYTSDILNTPEDDPEAYRRSSPLEYAEGLAKPLLICHGMLDDNVFFQDSVRLVQRLIELEKVDWESAVYPVEPHGFRRPSSWLDEYRRILKLFETHLRN